MSEQRYFKLYAQRHTIGAQNNYVKLFDAIREQKEYDEKKIVKQFRKESFIKRISSEKVYLYNLILKSMRSFREDALTENKLRGLLDDIRLLYDKGLYPQCEKLITKAIKLANQYEAFPEILYLLKWQRRLMEKKYYSDVKSEDIDELVTKVQKTADKINNLWLYNSVYSKMYLLYFKMGDIRAEYESNEFDAILANLPLKEENALSYEAKNAFYNIHALYSLNKNKYDAETYYSKKRLELMESNLHQIKEEPIRYLGALYNYGFSSSQDEKYKEVLTVIKKIRSLPKKFGRNISEYDLFLYSYTLELTVYNNAGQFNKGTKIINAIEQGIKEFSSYISPERKTNFYYLICYACFGSRNYSKALEYSNYIMNQPLTNYLKIAHFYGRILNLIIHYELKSEGALPYYITSTYRFLKKRNKVYKIEACIMNFLRKKTPAINSKKEMVAAFKELKNELVEISKDPFERKSLKYFDIISWVESKIENRPFAEVVMEKAKSFEIVN